MNTLDWILILFGLITCVPLLLAQLTILINPQGKQAKDILIGKDEEWRDHTHFKSAYALAITDWILFFPLFVTAIVGVILQQNWGYLFLAISGAIQLYINIFLWFFEKEYVYPACGPLRYYTYMWGNFMLWGTGSLLYGVYKFIN